MYHGHDERTESDGGGVEQHPGLNEKRRRPTDEELQYDGRQHFDHALLRLPRALHLRFAHFQQVLATFHALLDDGNDDAARNALVGTRLSVDTDGFTLVGAFAT